MRFISMFRLFFVCILSSLICICFLHIAYAENKYYLCGPDEDGCHKTTGFQYCACIPVNEENINKPYCLDFDKMTCTPLTESPHCDPGFIFKDQGSCLATIFQSEPEPPCKIKDESFCVENHTYFCGADGNPQSCHPGT